MLDGDDEVSVPFEWWLSRLCEEFSCLPSAALREWLNVPAGLLETLVEYRGYARAKALYDAADTAEARKRLPESPLIDLVERIEFELVQEVHSARMAKQR